MYDEPPTKPVAKRFYLLIACVVLAYLALAAGSTLTKSPWSDEAWFANAALNLATKGRMATTVIETAGTNLKGLDQHTYWVMPLHLVTQAGWYKIFGFSLFSLRLLSTVFGLIALASWFIIVKVLSGDQKVALLTVTILSCDYIFIMGASFGRPDMMSTAFGSAALACYLLLRERNLTLAILVGHSLVAVCGLTHPNGGVLFFAGLLFITLYFDRSRLIKRHAIIFAIPYLVGGAAWGAYILEAPSLFVSQFIANGTMGGRMSGIFSPFSALKNEIILRYLNAFGLGEHSVGSRGPRELKALILVAYIASIVCAVSIPTIRRHQGYRVLLILTGMFFLILTVFDGQKLSLYLIHIIPLYTAILAVCVRWCWTRRGVPKWLILLTVFGLMCVQVGGILYRIKQNPHEKSYMAAVRFLRHTADDKPLIMGSAVLGFQLGFDNLVDDVKLGFYSGKKPDLIVLGETYEVALREYQANEPRIHNHIERVLGMEYRQIYDRELYKIYERR